MYFGITNLFFLNYLFIWHNVQHQVKVIEQQVEQPLAPHAAVEEDIAVTDLTHPMTLIHPPRVIQVAVVAIEAASRVGRVPVLQFTILLLRLLLLRQYAKM